jgi:hypothetical protein
MSFEDDYEIVKRVAGGYVLGQIIGYVIGWMLLIVLLGGLCIYLWYHHTTPHHNQNSPMQFYPDSPPQRNQHP